MEKLGDRSYQARGRPIKSVRYKLVAVPQKSRLVGHGFGPAETHSPKREKSPKRVSLNAIEKPKFVLSESPIKNNYVSNQDSKPISRRPKKLGVSTKYHKNRANIDANKPIQRQRLKPKKEVNSPLIRRAVKQYIRDANIPIHDVAYRPKSPKPQLKIEHKSEEKHETEPKATPKQELTETRINHRLQQITIGKNTIGYKIYRIQIAKSKRVRKNPMHPQTPNANEDISERRWRGKLHKWRKTLHSYDERMPDLYKPSVTWFDSHTYPILTLPTSPRKSPKKSPKKNKYRSNMSPKREKRRVNRTPVNETIEIPQLPSIDHLLDLSS